MAFPRKTKLNLFIFGLRALLFMSRYPVGWPADLSRSTHGIGGFSVFKQGLRIFEDLWWIFRDVDHATADTSATLIQLKH